jgi:broad specificity phosphatase PhoE
MKVSNQTKTIYLIRHGQTEGNAKGHWLGAKSIHPLNEYGEKQARWTAKFLKEKNVDATKIYASPTPRALMHAEILQKRLQIPIEKIHSLSEIDLGILEDKAREEGLKLVPEEISDWQKDLEKFKPPLGESALEALERFCEIIELLAKNYPCRDIVIVSHGVVIKMFLAKILKKSLKTGETKIEVPSTTHGSITIIKFRKDDEQHCEGFKFDEVVENAYPDSKKVSEFG